MYVCIFLFTIFIPSKSRNIFLFIINFHELGSWSGCLGGKYLAALWTDRNPRPTVESLLGVSPPPQPVKWKKKQPETLTLIPFLWFRSPLQMALSLFHSTSSSIAFSSSSPYSPSSPFAIPFPTHRLSPRNTVVSSTPLFFHAYSCFFCSETLRKKERIEEPEFDFYVLCCLGKSFDFVEAFDFLRFCLMKRI